MKVALVTTPPEPVSGVGDYTRRLLPYLREHFEVHIFVATGLEGEAWPGETLHPVSALRQGGYDHLLYQLGNWINHTFMVPLVKQYGGTVVLHDWILFDLAMAAWPSLHRFGFAGLVRAFREGGGEGVRIWLENRLLGRTRRAWWKAARLAEDLPGTLLSGWYSREATGRWIGDVAGFRVPAKGCHGVKIRLSGEPGRRVRLALEARGLASVRFTRRRRTAELSAAFPPRDRPRLTLEVAPVRSIPYQRKVGDTRRLGAMVHSLSFVDPGGEHPIDLHLPPADPLPPGDIRRDRFRLAFNRSVTRNADAFIVHSEHLRGRIENARGRSTPVGVVPLGAGKRWQDEIRPGDRNETRTGLGLPAHWKDGMLLTSFGHVQSHKRNQVLLRALAAVRRIRPAVRLALVGGLEPEQFDVEALVAELDLGDAVHIAGHVSEEAVRGFLHASDVVVQLRGPTTGGSSSAVFEGLAHGRPVIGSALAEQRELPDACVGKIPPGGGEIESLTGMLVDLHDHPEKRLTMEAAARRYVEEECHLSHVAHKYAAFLREFPGPRGWG